jgi:hypothetical protein
MKLQRFEPYAIGPHDWAEYEIDYNQSDDGEIIFVDDLLEAIDKLKQNAKNCQLEVLDKLEKMVK